LPNLTLLAWPDRRERPEPDGASAADARLHLAEDQASAPGSNEVEFAEARPEVAVDDLVALPLQVPGGDPLTPSTEPPPGIIRHGERP
jgi:hypothetical protein